MSFPKDEERKLEWIKAVQREGWTPTKNSRICSDHFSADGIDLTSMSCTRIRNNAVPRIFGNESTQMSNESTQMSNESTQMSNESTQMSNEPTQQDTSTADLQQEGRNTTEIFQKQETAENVISVIERSPTKIALKRKVQKLEKLNRKHLKKIKLMQRQINRSKKKITDLNSVIADLKEKNLLETDSLDILSKACKINEELLRRQISKFQGKKKPKVYGAELKAFALTLYYYSPKAYNYLREKLLKSLPHCRTISKWYQHLNGMPGFTTEAFQMIENFNNHSEYPLVFALSFDEMAIHEHIEHDGKRYYGYVDYGTQIDDDSLPPAKEALVFLLVAINANFKVPVGYFLINGINSEQKANLVIQCLTLLHARKAKVVTLTCDGLS